MKKGAPRKPSEPKPKPQSGGTHSGQDPSEPSARFLPWTDCPRAGPSDPCCSCRCRTKDCWPSGDPASKDAVPPGCTIGWWSRGNLCDSEGFFLQEWLNDRRVFIPREMLRVLDPELPQCLLAFEERFHAREGQFSSPEVKTNEGFGESVTLYSF